MILSMTSSVKMKSLKLRDLYAKSMIEHCFAVRLAGGSSIRNGRLEVRYNGTWGTVCDDSFTDAAARVACFMLGYG